jgi:hypothetical protein
MLPVMGRPPEMVALNPEHTGCGHGSATLYAFPDLLSRIGAQHLPFSRERYADGEMEVRKMSIRRHTSTLPVGPGIFILVALALAWEIAGTIIIYLLCGDNWPWFL